MKFFRRKAAVLLVGGMICILWAAVGGCRAQDPVWLDPVPTPSPHADTDSSQLIEVFFTDPDLPGFRGGPDRALVEAIDRARYQVDGALYDFNLWSIRNALLRAHQRGVKVRLVVETDAMDREEIQELIDAGIPVASDQQPGLMHNKFFIIDASEVWTGSMNYTLNGAYRHLNNLVRMRSPLLAENYTVEFEEMFLDGCYGEIAIDNTPYPQLTLNGLQVETFFSPDDRTADRIASLLSGAEESIDFLYYAYTADELGQLMVAKARQGVRVRGVLDAYQHRAGLGSEYEYLKAAGLDVRLDEYQEKMHHKVIILDGEVVITGSANLTRSADTINDENTLILFDPRVAEIFLAEFEWIYAGAE